MDAASIDRCIDGEEKAGDALTPESHVARMDEGCIAQRASGEINYTSSIK